MHVLAAFFDPNDNGFDLTDLAAVILLILTVWGAVWGAFTWNAKRTARMRIAERAEMEARITAAVVAAAADSQPRNGGKGWMDLHGKVDALMERQTDVIRDVRGIRERLDDHIDSHHERS